MVRNGGFHQVTSTIHFVPVTKILPPHLGVSDGEVSIQIAVCLLGVDDPVGHLIYEGRQNRIGVRCQRQACRFRPFRQVRISKNQDDRRGE
jgi:hypothetical protein